MSHAEGRVLSSRADPQHGPNEKCFSRDVDKHHQHLIPHQENASHDVYQLCQCFVSRLLLKHALRYDITTTLNT